MAKGVDVELQPKDWRIAAYKTFALLGVMWACVFIYGVYGRNLDSLMCFLVGGGITIYCLIGIVFSFIFGIAARFIKISTVWKKAMLVSFSVFVFYLLLILLVLFIDTRSIDVDDVLACVVYGGFFVVMFMPIYTWLMVRKARKLENS